MKDSPSFIEDHISQIPALQLLINMGYIYIYLTPYEAHELRNEKTSNVIFEKVLDEQLRKINTINYKDKEYDFSNSNINAAVDSIKNIHFDGPNNTILYIAKSLSEHNLLQAIAMVNRLYDGKDFGFIIDYQGVLGELDKALSAYGALEGFDEDDLEGALTNIHEEINSLP